jgi:hypothetical protein
MYNLGSTQQQASSGIVKVSDMLFDSSGNYTIVAVLVDGTRYIKFNKTNNTYWVESNDFYQRLYGHM